MGFCGRGCANCLRAVTTLSFAFANIGSMDADEAIDVLGALAQPTRLQAFRLLVKSGPDGVTAGDIARAFEVPFNTMSGHLSVLSRAGLVRSRRQSRSIIYSAELSRMPEIALFLLDDCCGGLPEVCTPVLASLVQRNGIRGDQN